MRKKNRKIKRKKAFFFTFFHTFLLKTKTLVLANLNVSLSAQFVF